MDIERSAEEINAVRDHAWESMERGRSRYPGMTFEEGVAGALDWVTGERDEPPLDEN